MTREEAREPDCHECKTEHDCYECEKYEKEKKE